MADPLADFESYNCRGWDSYDAEPITPAVLARARSILKLLPSLADADAAPGGDGSICFELHRDGWDFWVDVGPGEEIQFHLKPFKE